MVTRYCTSVFRTSMTSQNGLLRYEFLDRVAGTVFVGFGFPEVRQW